MYTDTGCFTQLTLLECWLTQSLPFSSSLLLILAFESAEWTWVVSNSRLEHWRDEKNHSCLPREAARKAMCVTRFSLAYNTQRDTDTQLLYSCAIRDQLKRAQREVDVACTVGPVWLCVLADCTKSDGWALKHVSLFSPSQIVTVNQGTICG